MNKPVAIVNTNCENNIQWYDDNPKQHNGYFLYTHPVKELTLTDEEIEIAKNESTVYKGIYDGYGNGIGQKREIDYKLFAKAILRKASEK